MRLRLKEDKVKNDALKGVSKDIVTVTNVHCKICDSNIINYKHKTLAGIFEEIRIHESYAHNDDWEEIKNMCSFDKRVFSDMIDDDYQITQSVVESTFKIFKAGWE